MKNPKFIGAIVGALLLGGIIGAAVKQPETKTVTKTVTQTQTVNVEKTPASCLKAISGLADAGSRMADLWQQSNEAVLALDAARITQVTSELQGVTDDITALTPFVQDCNSKA